MTIDHIRPADEGPHRPGPERGFLAGRTALVTGGARRIGRALALALAGEGAVVVLHYRRSGADARDTAAAIEDRGGVCRLVAGDLAEAAVAGELPARAEAVAGAPIDILVNNASIFGPGEALETDAGTWDLHQAVNLRAPFILAREMARRLPAGRPGDVINLNDIRALKPGSDHFPYTISKVGLHGLTRSLALALAPHVRVNELMLGSILPPEGGDAGYVHMPVDAIPTRRFDTPVEVCRGMLALLANPAMTGQSICIDGGSHLL
ncbi:MAG: SDR family NAD(P)-dependent oxidoreductase [Candidatus Krumholzibacteriia bacterium]